MAREFYLHMRLMKATPKKQTQPAQPIQPDLSLLLISTSYTVFSRQIHLTGHPKAAQITRNSHSRRQINT